MGTLLFFYSGNINFTVAMALNKATLWECSCFRSALQPLIDALVEAFPHLPLNAWYADDGTLAIPKSLAPAVLSFLSKNGLSRGFHINMTKTQAWWLPYLPPRD